MVLITNKIVSNTYQPKFGQSDNQTKLSSTNNEPKQDVFVSSETQKKDKKKTIAYVLGGLAVAGAIIFAITKSKKKTPSGKDVKNITDESKNIEKNLDNAINKESELDAKQVKLDEELAELEATKAKEKELARQDEILVKQDTDLIKRNIELAEQKAKIEKYIDDVIQVIKPKDELIAKEAIPVLVEHSEKLGISLPHFNNYIEQITPENKEFAIKEGLPLIAENMNKLKSVFSDVEDAHELLGALTPENKTTFNLLLDKAKILKIEDTRTLVSNLKNTTSKNSAFISKELIPTIEKNPNNFKFLEGWNSEQFFELFKEGDKNNILNNILPKTLKNFEQSKLKNDSADLLKALEIINKTNENFIFNDLWPHLMANTEKYKIQHGEEFLNYIKVITPENKDFALNEAMPLLIKYGDKLELQKGYKIAKVLGSLTPENKDCIPLIAKNAEKLGFETSLNNASLLEELLKNGKEDIKKRLNKS